ncbi:MAG TPA: ribonuclease P protein component [Opitutaceae bacterium]|nr:ribonuclease P protein component [Opitutaceae bacterium]
MRFRAEQHLRRQRDFRTARERGRRIDCGGFTLWYVRRADENVAQPRAGVVASTAAVGNAVKRNRAKRRLREVFRRNQMLVPADFDLLMIAKRSLEQAPYEEIERRFVDACRKIFSEKT